jgi:hypothetical protein
MTLKQYLEQNMPPNPSYAVFYKSYIEGFRLLHPTTGLPTDLQMSIIFETYYNPRPDTIEPPPIITAPHIASRYEVGAILEYSYGYEQTNVKFYCVTYVKGEWVTIQQMHKNSTPLDSNMCNTSTPTTINGTVPPIRKKVKSYNGEPGGFSINDTGYCSLWDGKPSRESHYA